MSVIANQGVEICGGYAIRSFHESDAAQITEGFRQVYGEHYPTEAVYDPMSFVTANREGKAISFVAQDGTGRVVGHIALVRSAPSAGLVEIAQGIVLKEHRGTGLFRALIARAIREAGARSDICGVFSTAITNHTISQRLLHEQGLVDTGLEIDYVPQRLFAKEGAAQGNVATVLQYLPIRKEPDLPVYAPRGMEDLLRGILARLGEEREFAEAPEVQRIPFATRSDDVDLPRFDLVRMTVHQAGGDVRERLQALERHAREKGWQKIQLVLDLGQSETPLAAVEALQEGYWFAGLLPRWFGTDGLLLQKGPAQPNFDEIKLCSEAGLELLAHVQKEWSEAQPDDRLAA